MDPEIQFFFKFSKKVQYVIQLLVVHQCTHNFKSIAQYLTPKWSVFVSEIIPIYDVTFSNAIFFCNFRGSYVKTNGTIRFLSKHWSR